MIRRSEGVLVPAENLAYSLANDRLLGALAGIAHPYYGIFASWTALC